MSEASTSRVLSASVNVFTKIKFESVPSDMASKKFVVPDLATVPKLLMRSAFDMPTPVSVMVIFALTLSIVSVAVTSRVTVFPVSVFTKICMAWFVPCFATMLRAPERASASAETMEAARKRENRVPGEGPRHKAS